MRSFSIIIPFKTGKSYLKCCIESVFSQNYKNFRIIVLTDATSNQDGSVDYLKSINQHNIEIIESSENLDILKNWDRILSVSKDEFMTILGYDDILYPNYLIEINNLINEYPDASLYHTHFNYINKEGTYLKKCKKLPKKLSSDEYLSMSLNGDISVMATGYVFRTNDYKKIGGIDIKYPNLIYADLKLWIELSEISYLVISSNTCFEFRIHSSTTKISKDKTLLMALVEFLNFLKEIRNKSDQYNEVIKSRTGLFLEETTKSISHRLLKTPVNERLGLKIIDIRNILEKKSKELGINYNPEKNKSFRIALIIERFSILNLLFIFFKMIYTKPIIND